MPTAVKPRRKSPARPKGRATKRSTPRARSTAGAAVKDGGQSPSWAELAGKAGPSAARRRERETGFVDAVPTLRFAVWLAIACAGLTLYVGHLYASQTLVEEVQELRKERDRLALQQNRLRGEFDRITAPAVILDRASAIGLHASGDYAATVIIAD